MPSYTWPEAGLIYCEREDTWCAYTDLTDGSCKAPRCDLYDPDRVAERERQWQTMQENHRREMHRAAAKKDEPKPYIRTQTKTRNGNRQTDSRKKRRDRKENSMSAKQDQAKMKLAEEIKEHPEYIPFEEHMTEKCTSDIVADRILDESKKLSGAYSAVRKAAEKNKTGGVGYVSDAEAYKIIEKYYGINTAATSEHRDTSNVVDITELL